MTKEAVVVNTPNGLMAQIKRQEACLTCRACDFGRCSAFAVAVHRAR